MKIHATHRPEALDHSKPWYEFATGRNLDDWQAHFRDKDIPHVVVANPACKRTRYAIWLRFQPIAPMSKTTRIDPDPPACVLALGS